MENSQILKELNACMALCNICFKACLKEEDLNSKALCIELTRECADICQLTASLLLRDSENLDKFIKLCGEICENCAEENDRYEEDYCQKCAHVCHKCSEMCYDFLILK
jgi:hypothetical protein